MRYGHGADFPQQRQRLPASAVPSAQHAAPVQARFHASHQAPAHDNVRGNVARLFFDLRRALGLTPEFAAAQLVTEPDVILALESGAFELLPDWEETSRVVLTYAAFAGIDGQPALTAIAEVLRQSAPPQVSPQPAARRSGSHGHGGLPVGRFFHDAGAAIAYGAKRLPAGALKQVRERPERAFYALSLPLGLLLLALNTSIVQIAFSYIPRPAADVVRDVRTYFQVQFAPVREGLRWIDVDDPRERRGDKLPRRRQSD